VESPSQNDDGLQIEAEQQQPPPSDPPRAESSGADSASLPDVSEELEALRLERQPSVGSSSGGEPEAGGGGSGALFADQEVRCFAVFAAAALGGGGGGSNCTDRGIMLSCRLPLPA